MVVTTMMSRCRHCWLYLGEAPMPTPTASASASASATATAGIAGTDTDGIGIGGGSIGNSNNRAAAAGSRPTAATATPTISTAEAEAEAELIVLFSSHYQPLTTVFAYYAGAGHGAGHLSSISMAEWCHFIQSAGISAHLGKGRNTVPQGT